MATTPEGKVKKEVAKWLRDNDIWYFMPMQNGMGVVGIPDFICCWRGEFLAIETKAPGKLLNLTPNQKNRIREIEEHGGTAYVVDSLELLIELLQEKLGELNGHKDIPS